MTPARTLLLSHANSATPNDIGNGYLREFLKTGAAFLDCHEIYLEHGYSGSQRFLKDFITANGIEVVNAF